MKFGEIEIAFCSFSWESGGSRIELIDRFFGKFGKWEITCCSFLWESGKKEIVNCLIV